MSAAVSEYTGREVSEREFDLEQLVAEMVAAIEEGHIKDNSYEGNHCRRLKAAALEVLTMEEE